MAKKAPASDSTYLDCPGCRGKKSTRKAKSPTGKAVSLPCKTCSGKGALPLTWFKKNDPETYLNETRNRSGRR